MWKTATFNGVTLLIAWLFCFDIVSLAMEPFSLGPLNCTKFYHRFNLCCRPSSWWPRIKLTGVYSKSWLGHLCYGTFLGDVIGENLISIVCNILFVSCWKRYETGWKLPEKLLCSLRLKSDGAGVPWHPINTYSSPQSLFKESLGGQKILFFLWNHTFQELVLQTNQCFGHRAQI